MGEVYSAYDTSLERQVAIKILRTELLDRPDRVRRFIQEAKSASALNHPHIVTIHEIGEAIVDGCTVHYIAMELVQGTTLGHKIRTERAQLKRLLQLLAQVAQGLAKAHAAGIVHRDLKPDNIMVTTDGYAKIVDFGLAKLIEDRLDPTSFTPTLTREGALLGTIGYMAPEQVQHRNVDHHADIFSFGCILYEAVTRRRAFAAGSDVDVLYQILHHSPPAIMSVAPETPEELQRIIERCLEKSPHDRYDSMKDVAMELAEVERQLPTQNANRNLRGRSRGSAGNSRTRKWTVAVTSLLLLGGVTAAVIHQRPQSARHSVMSALVTWPSDEWDCYISPDGQWFSFLSTRSGQPAIWLRRTAGGEPMLLRAGPPEIRGHIWSPASDRIAYLSVAADVPYLQFIPAFGGAPTASVKLDRPFESGRLVRWIGSHLYLETGAALWKYDTGIGKLDRVIAPLMSARREWFDVRADEKLVIFQLTRGKHRSVWFAKSDGSDATRLTDDSYGAFAPRFGGPDGDVFFSSDRSGQVDLWRKSLRNNSTEQITASPSIDWVEDVSSDGKRLVYLDARDESHLWVVDPKSGEKQVTADALQDIAPSSSDVAHVAFQRRKPVVEGGPAIIEGDIFVADLSDAQLRNPRLAVSNAGIPRLSPDGNELAFVRVGEMKRYELWLKDLRSEHQWRVASAFKIPGLYKFPQDWYESNLAWSSKSDRVFFVNRPEARRQEIASADSSGSPAQTIVTASAGTDLRDLFLSADGRSLIYVRKSGTRSEVVLRDLDSGRESILFRRDGQERVFCRGWTVFGEVVVLVSRTWTDDIEAIRIDRQSHSHTLKLAARGFPGGARLARASSAIVMTTVDTNGSHNVDVFSLADGRVQRITRNQLPTISFGALEVLADGKILLTRQEKNQDLWQIEFTR
jgi:serine/threonine protein kinase/WD40 repeat protein